VAQHVLDESPNGGKPAIACGSGVVAFRLEVMKERENLVDFDVFQSEIGNGAVRLARKEQEEEAQRVRVRPDGVGAGASNALQVIPEIRFDETKERVDLSRHDQLRVCARRRFRRCAAN
jgi:hypothetical protein